TIPFRPGSASRSRWTRRGSRVAKRSSGRWSRAPARSSLVSRSTTRPRSCSARSRSDRGGTSWATRRPPGTATRWGAASSTVTCPPSWRCRARRSRSSTSTSGWPRRSPRTRCGTPRANDRGRDEVARPDHAGKERSLAVIDNPGILLYTRIRKSPYFYASREHGVARYSVYNHTYHPRHYGDPVAEYWHLVNGVTMWDVGVEKQIQIKGQDAFDLTNMIVPRDLNKCAVNECKYVFITGPDGGILNDPVLLRVAEDEFWLSLADSDVNLYALGIAAAKGMDVTVQEIDVAPVQIQAPNAKKVLTELLGERVLEIPYYGLMQGELDGMDVVVSRTGYTGEVGYEIYLREASEHGVQLWNRVLEAGKPHGLEVIGPCHI